MTKRSAAEKMLLIFSAFAATTIPPFVYFRWLDDDMVMASIDAITVFVTAVFFRFCLSFQKS
jgi:hypothetical protein